LRPPGPLGQTSAADRKFVRFDPELFFPGKPPVAAPIDVDAGPLQDSRDADRLSSKGGVKTVDQDLILIELDLTQASRPSRPDLGRKLELRARALGRARLDGQPGRGRAWEPDPRPGRRRGGSRGQWLGGGERRRTRRSGGSRFGRGPGGRPAHLWWRLLRRRSGARRRASRLCNLRGARGASRPGRLFRRSLRRTHPRIS